MTPATDFWSRELRQNWAKPTPEQLAAVNSIDLDEAAAIIDAAAEDCPFHWDEIQSNPRVTTRMPKPESDPLNCPHCARPMKWLYWSNDTPPELLCLRRGFVEICRKCKFWLRFELRVMS